MCCELRTHVFPKYDVAGGSPRAVNAESNCPALAALGAVFAANNATCGFEIPFFTLEMVCNSVCDSANRTEFLGSKGHKFLIFLLNFV
jgi:hypothetical protein